MNDIDGLLSEFRNARGQELKPPQKNDGVVNSVHAEYDKGKTHSASKWYNHFLALYDDMENTIDDWTVRDLMYYFREKSRENGCNYVIHNMKRDMGIFKTLCSNFSNRDIVLMIEFLYESGQKYLSLDTLQPTVLSSNWVITIQRDAHLWLDDKFDLDKKNVDKKKPSLYNKKATPSREYTKPNTGKSKVRIGAWK